MTGSAKMSRRVFIRRHLLPLCGATFALGNTGTAFSSSSPRRRPNILLVLSDDQGWGDLPSNWGKTNIRMPTMEAVGRAGIRFTSFYVNPLCAPTRASILTGLYSMENGMWRGPSRKVT
ncbi:MAG: sulfatase-like hydrolase/transferase, partial [Phycisphaerales bacterium]